MSSYPKLFPSHQREEHHIWPASRPERQSATHASISRRVMEPRRLHGCRLRLRSLVLVGENEVAGASAPQVIRRERSHGRNDLMRTPSDQVAREFEGALQLCSRRSNQLEGRKVNLHDGSSSIEAKCLATDSSTRRSPVKSALFEDDFIR